MHGLFLSNVEKALALKLANILLLVSFSLLIGCSSRTQIDFSEHLSKKTKEDYQRKFEGKLPYDEIVKAIHTADSNKTLTRKEKAKFDNAIYLIVNASVEYTLKRLDVSEDERKRILNRIAYNKRGLSHFYLNEFRNTRAISVGELDETQIIKYSYFYSVEKFARILSHNICEIANVVVGFVVPSPKVKLAATVLSMPFEILLYEAILPITEQMQNHALILDQINAKIVIKKHLRSMIMELATVEDEIVEEIDYKPEKTILWWKSNAEINYTVKAKVKAGFDLMEKFEVDIMPKEQQINVYMPRPEILSVEMMCILKRMENGWFIEVDTVHINDLQALAKSTVLSRVKNSMMLENAKINARKIVNKILKLMMQTPYFAYKINLIFG